MVRRARLGQKMEGIARVYDHVTDVMKKQVLDALEARWTDGVHALTTTERDQLVGWFPHLGPNGKQALIKYRDGTTNLISSFAPFDH